LKFETIIFDLGSTLINYENHSWDELGILGCRNACPILNGLSNQLISPELLWNDFHYAIDKMFENHTEDLAEIDLYEVTSKILVKLGINVADGLATRFVEAYYQPITSQITLIPGAEEMLQKLKDSGLKIGLVSNTIFPAAFHRTEMKRFGILRFFDFTIFSSEFKFRKPKKEIFLKALELAGSQPENTVFVGDRLVEDIGGPQALGIRAVLVFAEGRDYSGQITPYRTIYKLSELEKIIFS
jgi:HAD superfamily hydrolase (TIGR01549 family)